MKTAQAAGAMKTATEHAHTAGTTLIKAKKDLAELKGTPEEVDKYQATVTEAKKAKEHADAKVEELRFLHLPSNTPEVEAAKAAARMRESKSDGKSERESANAATYGATVTVSDTRNAPY